MEFFIKKNATLPILKFEIFKDGRSDYNQIYNLTGITSSYITLYDINNNNLKIASRPCTITTGYSEYDETKILYFVEYQFKNSETKKLGRFEAIISIIENNGSTVLPLQDKVFVNIIDSFSIDGFSFTNNYEVEYPCCNQVQPVPIPPTPTNTPTNTVTPTETPTNTPTPTTTVTITPSITPDFTPSSTPTVTPTITESPTNTPTSTTTPTLTPTNTPTQTQTPTTTPTPTLTKTSTVTPTVTRTPTKTVTSTSTVTPTNTITPTITPTNSSTPPVSPSVTPTKSVTPTITTTPSFTPTTTITPTVSPTTTITPTVSPSYVPPSVIVYSFDNSGVVYSYNFGTSTVTDLNPPQNPSITTKNWLAYADSNVFYTNNGYSGFYKQNNGISSSTISIGIGGVPDPGFCVIPGLLLASRYHFSTTQKTIVGAQTSGLGGSFTFRGRLPIGRYCSGGMIRSNGYKLIIITSNSLNTSSWITQYPFQTTSNDLVPEFEINLTNIISNPRGLFVANSELYIASNSGEIYHVQKTSPYTITYVTSIGRTVNGIAQNSTNWTMQFS